MDTKERTRRRAGSVNKAPSRRKAAVKARRRTAGTGTKTARQNLKRRPVRRRNTAPRTVRPPREDIPAVTYTMPKPFSRGTLLLKLASVAAAVAAVVMCLSLFFQVEEVLVSGAEKYTPWMVMEASGISKGDSLLSISDARVSGNVISKLPYVKEVRVGIKLPGTVHIEIKELETTYAIQARDGSWWLITADGRVVESIETTAASGYTRIVGVQVDAPRVDQQVQAVQDPQTETEATQPSSPDGVTLPQVVQVTNAQRLDAVKQILQALEENGVIGQIALVDVSNFTDITMEYGQRLTIVLGTAENLAYKVSYMAQAVKQIEDYQTGELDVSFKYSDQGLLNPGE